MLNTWPPPNWEGGALVSHCKMGRFYSLMSPGFSYPSRLFSVERLWLWHAFATLRFSQDLREGGSPVEVVFVFFYYSFHLIHLLFHHLLLNTQTHTHTHTYSLSELFLSSLSVPQTSSLSLPLFDIIPCSHSEKKFLHTCTFPLKMKGVCLSVCVRACMRACVRLSSLWLHLQ